VLSWCAWYTRALPDQVSAARRDEIASDLFEQEAWADAAHHSAGRTARSILRRWIAGVPADLAWRSAQVRGSDSSVRSDIRIRELGSALVVMMLAFSAVLTLVGVVVDWRMLGTVGQNLPPATAAMATMSGGTVLALVALMMLVRPRQRHVGALAGAAAALLVPLPALDGLWYVSASTQVVAAAAPWLHAVVLLLSAGIATLFLGGAIWWTPTAPHRPRERRSSDSEGETP